MMYDEAWQIIDAQAKVVNWAKAYEEGEGLVSDIMYDNMVGNLQYYKKHFPEIWEKIDHPLFRTDMWEYTGSFIKQ